MRLKYGILGWLLTICVVTSASGQISFALTMADPAAMPAAPADGALDQILTEWAQRSAPVESLQVVFERTDRSLKWGDQIYQGQLLIQGRDRACLEIRKARTDDSGKPLFHEVDGQKVVLAASEPFQRLVWTGKELFQYEWDERSLFIYPADSQFCNKLWETLRRTLVDLPFLFQISPAEFKGRYDLKLIKRDDHEAVIQIKPREQIDRLHFVQAVLWLDRATGQPTRLRLDPVGENESQEFRYTTVKRNVAIDPTSLGPIAEQAGWKVNRFKVGSGIQWFREFLRINSL